MAASVFDLPDEFTQSPFFALLANNGDVSKLEAFAETIPTRIEKIHSIIEANQALGNLETLEKLQAELSMLTTVIEWIRG